MSSEDDSRPPSGSAIVGVAAFALLVVGVSSAFSGLIAVLQSKPDFVGSGLLFIASAIAFGQTLNCMLRK